MPSVFFGRIGRSNASHRPWARIGRPASVRMCYVSRVVRHVEAGRLLDGRQSEDGEEGLAGVAQVLALRVEFAEARGEFLVGRTELSGLLAQFALAGVDVGEDVPDLRAVAHAVLQEDSVVPVSQHVMTEVIAQRNRDATWRAGCSSSRTSRRQNIGIPFVCSTTHRLTCRTKPVSARLRSTTWSAAPTGQRRPELRSPTWPSHAFPTSTFHPRKIVDEIAARALKIPTTCSLLPQNRSP